MTFDHRKFFLRSLKLTSQTPSSDERSAHPLVYSWILNGRLAVGPIPKSRSHWSQLEGDGFSTRFSCCYPYEHIFPENPDHWISAQVSLPDHRGQEVLRKERLYYALDIAKEFLQINKSPLYLHCFAGQERSVLVAVGLICILKDKDLFDGLNYIKQCHNNAKPLYNHLEILDQVLRDIKEI